MKDILSFLTIYTIENFIESLGAIDKRDDGLSEFALWDGDTFQTSKKYLKEMTQQSYYARDSGYINQIQSDASKQYLDMADSLQAGMTGQILNSALKNLPRWKRKKQRPVPPGTDPCEGFNR